jgi:glycosyltransferase involved in cell wall biosynthesis
VRILILDLKWSYGIEAITGIIHDQLKKRCEVTVIAAAESLLPYSIKIAKSRSYRDMLLAFFNPMVYVRVLREVRRIQPEIIYILSPHMLNVPIAILLRLFCSACVISHIHDPDNREADQFVAARAKDAVALLQARCSNRIYCWGETLREAIGDKLGVPTERISAFRHGPGQRTTCDENPEMMASGSRPRYFSLVGELRERKGIEFFLEAACLFNERHGADAVQFLLAGAGDLAKHRPAIERIPNLLIQNRFIEDSEVNEFLSSSYASVLPYTAGFMQSSFIAIAYGNGCPVIVSNIGGLAEDVDNGDTGFIVERANAKEIAAAMERIYTGWDKLRLSENCIRVYREKFTWDEIGDQMYQDMVIAATKRMKKRETQQVEQPTETGRSAPRFYSRD